jgi:hypothetical protein
MEHEKLQIDSAIFHFPFSILHYSEEMTMDTSRPCTCGHAYHAHHRRYRYCVACAADPERPVLRECPHYLDVLP